MKKKIIEIPAFSKMVMRMIKALCGRVVNGDIEDLLELKCQILLSQTCLDIAVNEFIKQGRSLSEIGSVLGMTKQAVHKRWVKK